MISLASLMVTDAYEHGGWVDDPPGLKGIGLKVRNIGSSAFKRLQAELIDELPRYAKARGLTQTHSERITERCIREVLLLDWRGIEHEGKELPFSPEWAEKLMASPVFRDAVVWCANLVGTPGDPGDAEHQAMMKEGSDALIAGVKAVVEQPPGGSA